MFTWRDYTGALLDAVKKSGVDLYGRDLSPLGLITLSDVADNDALVANWSILELGDTVPRERSVCADGRGVCLLLDLLELRSPEPIREEPT